MINAKINKFFMADSYYFSLVILSYFIFPRIISGIRLEDLLIAIAGAFYTPFFIKNAINNIKIIIFVVFIFYSLFLSFYSDLIYSSLEGNNWIIYSKYLIYFFTLVYGFVCGYRKLLNNSLLIKLLMVLVLLNFGWCFYQLLSGSNKVLLGTGDEASYGIRFIGEAAAFQVGSMLSFITIFMSIAYSKNRHIYLLLLIFISIYFLYLSESRINLLSTIVVVVVLFLLKVNFYKKAILLFFTLFICLSVYEYNENLFSVKSDNNRFTSEGILDSYNSRGNDIWADPIEMLNKEPFVFYGLGSLKNYNINTVEMHNYYLKLIFEGGFIYLFIFMAFVTFIIFTKPHNFDKEYDFSLLLKLYLVTLLLSAFLQDSFASNKAVYPFYFLVGYVIATNLRLKHERFF